MSCTFGSVLLRLIKAKEMQMCRPFLTQMSWKELGIFSLVSRGWRGSEKT